MTNKKELLKKYIEELESIEQYIAFCGHGVKDIQRKMWLEDEIHHLKYGDSSSEETSEEEEE